MRFLLLLVAVGCSSSKPSESTTTTQSRPSAGGGDVSTGTAIPAGQSSAQPAVGQSGSKPSLYSCFSYTGGNTTTQRHNCMRTLDCPDMLEQAKQVKGVRDLTGCAPVTSVWCFHQVVQGDSEGVDVCQPTVEDCTATRAAVVKAKESVDTECAAR